MRDKTNLQRNKGYKQTKNTKGRQTSKQKIDIQTYKMTEVKTNRQAKHTRKQPNKIKQTNFKFRQRQKNKTKNMSKTNNSKTD